MSCWRTVPSRLGATLTHQRRNITSQALWKTRLFTIECHKSFSSIPSPKIVIDTKDIGTITVRAMTEPDLKKANSLIQTRNLIDFSESDIYSAFQSPNFVAVVMETEDKEIIGITGFQNSSKNIVFGGHHFVSKNYRGMALGKYFYEFGHQYCFQHRTVFSYGFEELESYYPNINLYFDKAFGKFIRLQGEFSQDYLEEKTNCDVEIVQVGEDIFPRVVLYDAGIHTLPRPEILTGMYSHPTTRTYAAMSADDIRGFAMLKKCYGGCYKIAPLYADGPLIAQKLFQKAVRKIPEGCPATMIVTSNNDFTNEFVTRNNLKVYDSMLRQLNKKDGKVPFSVDFNKVFCLTDSHFGMC